MQIVHRLYTPQSAGIDLLRLVLCGMIFTHGFERLWSASPVLGQYLSTLGFPLGPWLAQLISVFEVAGALLLAARCLVVPIAALFILLYLCSILLFHRYLGFWVIGPSDNGWELSLMLCAASFAVLCDGLAERLPASYRRIGMDVLRVLLCSCIFAHGAHRLLTGHSNVLGDILTEKGFPFGLEIIIGVNLVETVGTALIAMRLMVFPVSLLLICFYVVGIVWFHWHWGFFIVAPGDLRWTAEGWGWEYSLLLITCLVATCWDNRSAPLRWIARRPRADGGSHYSTRRH
ncbi:DoxX family protein [Duganella qianjiadongensis]|uniref:DoxX family membrane protein n=1 Tax=Duganella qianjiadongensis TaxID=2692176 RepID=A0ABW9VIZ8_9BURK|nr:DoxX family protein [Duganella qianjiadongensis]MYM39461.1 DoxX family membrane protein [Duganella qianjiadongensis]